MNINNNYSLYHLLDLWNNSQIKFGSALIFAHFGLIKRPQEAAALNIIRVCTQLFCVFHLASNRKHIRFSILLTHLSTNQLDPKTTKKKQKTNN